MTGSTQPIPGLPLTDPDAGSIYEALLGELLIDPVSLSAEIKAEIQAPLQPPAPEVQP